MENKVQNIYPITGVQKGIMYHHLKQYDDTYTCILSFYLQEPNIAKLEESLNIAVANNESLRGLFKWEKLENPVFITYKNIHRHINEITKDEEKIIIDKPIEIDKHPIWDVYYIAEQDKVKIIFKYHHILLDGWSLSQFMNEWLDIYYGKSVNTNKASLSEYHRYIKNTDWDFHKSYWSHYLAGIDSNTELPLCCCPAEQDNFTPNKKILNLSSDVVRRIKEVSKDFNVTVASVFLATWGILLQKYNQTNDVTFGYVSSGRDLPIKNIEHLVGLLINTIPTRLKTDSTATIKETLKHLHDNSIEQREHSLLPLYEIKEQMKKPIDLFDTLLVIENYPIDSSINRYLTSGAISEYKMIETNNYKLSIGVTIADNISIEFDYFNNFFSESTIQQLMRQFEFVLQQIINSPDKKIDSIEIINAKEKDKIINSFNNTDKAIDISNTVFNLIRNNAMDSPDTHALVYKNKVISYHQLLLEAYSLADRLIELGATKNDIVGIYCEMCSEAVVAMIAILSIGSSFFPIDTGYHDSRKKDMIESSELKYIITKSEYESELLDYNLKISIYEKDAYSNNINANRDVKNQVYSNRAYLIGSSGSTGKPKFIQINNDSFLDFTLWANREFQYTKNCRSLLSNSFASDSGIQQIFPALTSSATLHILDPDVRKDPYEYIHYLQENQINILDEVPSIINIMAHAIESKDLDRNGTVLPHLNCITLGSEYVPTQTAIYCKEKLNHQATVINSYGPAECSVDAASYTFKFNKNEISLIGKPRNNTKIYILDDNLNICPIGISGQICISGRGVSSGYYKNEALTKAKFVHNPFSDKYNVMYLSGDIGRWFDDGNIEYLGRNDHQVQIHGQRVEIGEIEQYLHSVFNFKNIAIVSPIDEQGQIFLVAFIETEKQIEKREIFDKLNSKFPHYMIPRKLIFLDKLLLNANSKIDINYLTELAKEEITQHVLEPPRNDLDKKVLQIWQEVLNTTSIGVSDNFFEIGGNSIKIMYLYMKLNKEFPSKKIEVQQLFSLNTIAQISDYYGDKTATGTNVTQLIKHPKDNINQDIAIIGIGLKVPQANNINEFWNILETGQNCIHKISDKRKILDLNGYPDKTYLEWGYLDDIDMFDPLFFKISPKVAAQMDPHQRLLLEITNNAIEDAGYSIQVMQGSKTGVFVSSILPQYYRYVDAGIDEILLSNLPANLSGRISYHFGFEGPSYVIDSACSSAMSALYSAVLSLRNQDCEMAIVGGASIELELLDKVVVDSSNIASPSQRCNTFSKDADGTIGGEGCIAILLKPLEKAQQDNDNIYSIIKGISLVQDGARSNGITAPNYVAQAETILGAVQDAHIDINNISYIEAHGSATKLGDPIEISGLKKAFSDSELKENSVAIGCAKTNIGHLDNIAGLAGLVKTALCLHQKKMVPSINFTEINPFISFSDSCFYYNTNLKLWPTINDKVRTAGVSSFGLSGTNAHVILEEYPGNTDALNNSVPVYDKKSYWVDTSIKKPKEETINLLSKPFFHAIDWIEQNIETDLNASNDNVFIVSNGSGFSNGLSDSLSKYVCVKKHVCLSKENTDYIDITSIEQLDVFFQENQSDVQLSNRIIFVLDDFSSINIFSKNYKKYTQHFINKYLYGLRNFISKLNSFGTKKVDFITNNVNQVLSSDESFQPEKIIISSLSKVINSEISNITSKVIDIENPYDILSNYDYKPIINEILGDSKLKEVAFRNGTRWVPILQSHKIIAKKGLNPYLSNKVYLVTGGTGGVSLEICRSISMKNNVTFILISRHGLNGEERQKAKVDKIIANGSTVEVYKTDITDFENLKATINMVEEKYGSISGVIHAAGVAGVEKDFVELTDKMFEDVLAPKIFGTIYLEKIFRNRYLDFFVSFSSLDVFLVNLNNSPYLIANSFLNSFSMAQQQLSKNFISISWGGWRQVGMGVKENQSKKDLEKSFDKFKRFSPVMLGFDLQDGLDAFDTILSQKLSNAIVTEMNVEDIDEFKENGYFLVADDIMTTSYNKHPIKTDFEYSDISNIITDIWIESLGLETIEDDKSYFLYGGNSINGVEIIFKMMDTFQLDLNVKILFEFDTISKLSKYIHSLIQQGSSAISDIPKAQPLK